MNTLWYTQSTGEKKVTEEPISPMMGREMLQPEQAAELPKHQNLLQDEARTGLQVEERYFFMAFYHTQRGSEWKIDISFWLGAGIHPEPVDDAIEQQLTPETQRAILWIKDVWYRLPAYRQEVYSTDIYEAVLQHGVRTPTEFDHYLAHQGKPTRADRL